MSGVIAEIGVCQCEMCSGEIEFPLGERASLYRVPTADLTLF
jgi:hypothetical protein